MYKLLAYICAACLLVFVAIWLISPQAMNEKLISVLPSQVVEKIWGAEAVVEAHGFETGVEEHADSQVDEGKEIQENQEDSQAQEEPEPVPADPVVYDENPRYTIVLNLEQGEILRSEVQKGDTAGKILEDWFTKEEQIAILAAAKPVYPLTNIHIGRPFAVVRTVDTKQPRLFKYEMDKSKRLVVERVQDKFEARLENIEYDTKLELIRGVLTNNLINAVTGLGEDVGFAIALADVFGSEINFITDPRVGDTFEALVEKNYRNGKLSDYGRIVSARYLNDGKQYEAYVFRNAQGRTSYFTSKGESLHRALLKAPLSFLRVTSKYTMARRHPVHGNVRPHQGVDYGAAHGTPIMAVGHGTVSLAGRAGGYGNQIILKHANGLESMYGHMSRFAKGIRKGKTVSQGQIIGYVGSTGISTGPHLDFRIKQRGRFVNPTKLVVPRDPGVAKNQMDQFKNSVDYINKLWADGADLSAYDKDFFSQGN